MVGPVNYRLDVLDPIQGYLQGLQFGENVQTQRLGREATRQGMDIQRQTFEEQQRARAEARAAAARAQAQAEAGQEALARLAELGAGATSDDFLQAWVANPAIRDDLTALRTMLTEPQTQALLTTNQNLYAAASQGNVNVTRSLLEEQLLAAENSGDQSMVPALRLALDRLDTDPQGALSKLRTTTGMTLMGLRGPEYIKTINDALGIGAQDLPADYRNLELRAEAAGLQPGTPEYQEFMRSGGATLGENFRPATAEEAAQYGASAGQIDVTSGRFYPINPPTGMTVRTTPEGGVELVQGPGVGGDTGKRSTDYVYGTDDQGRPVARPIEGTPAASEVQQARGQLEASISVGEDMLRTIESVVGRPEGDGLTAIRPNEALSGVLGLIEGNLPARTQAQADLLAKIDQISGRAFLEAFATLKGGGQITEAEGTKATQALARLQRTQSPEAFQQALYEFADIVRRGIQRSQNELTVLPEIAPATQAAPTGRIRYDAEGNRIE